MRDMVGRFYRAGGLLTAGSDGGIPGLSLHRELEQLRLSGLTPLDCLRAATINAARVLGKEAEIGSIRQGKQADLILVSGNPLEDPANLRRVAFTVQQGRIVHEAASRP